MNDFLTRLAERQLAAVPAISPRVPSRFAPAPAPVPEAPASASSASSAVDHEPVTSEQRVIVRVDTETRTDVSMTPAVDHARTVASPVDRRHEPPPPRVTPMLPEIGRHTEDLALAPPRVPDAESRPTSHVEAAPSAAVARPREDTAPDRLQPDRTPTRRADPPASPEPLVPRSPHLANVFHPPLPALDSPPAVGTEPPPVRVTIGRIEVRAVTPPRRERTTVDRHKALSLEDYLDRRHGGRR